MLLNIALTGEPKVPLHFQLHRNAMTIPAGPSRYPVTLHCHVPGENVLEYPGLDMMHAWTAVRGRWPVVEPEQLAIRFRCSACRTTPRSCQRARTRSSTAGSSGCWLTDSNTAASPSTSCPAIRHRLLKRAFQEA